MLVITHYQRLLELHRARQSARHGRRADPEVGRAGARATSSSVGLCRIPGEGRVSMEGELTIEEERQASRGGAAGRRAVRARRGAGEARDERSGLEDQGGAGAQRDLCGDRRRAAGRRGVRDARERAIGRFERAGAAAPAHRGVEVHRPAQPPEGGAAAAVGDDAPSRRSESTRRWGRSPSSRRIAWCSSMASTRRSFRSSAAVKASLRCRSAAALDDESDAAPPSCLRLDGRDDDAVLALNTAYATDGAVVGIAKDAKLDEAAAARVRARRRRAAARRRRATS